MHNQTSLDRGTAVYAACRDPRSERFCATGAHPASVPRASEPNLLIIDTDESSDWAPEQMASMIARQMRC